MKSIIYDLRRALTGRWFFIALAASAASLYISIGYQSYQLASMLSEPDVYAAHFQLNAAELVQHGMQGEFGVMILPALSALPFAAQALQEIKSGAIRPAVFRAFVATQHQACQRQIYPLRTKPRYPRGNYHIPWNFVAVRA